jgi:ABC-type lipoprotein release transport system permease subunit
MIAIVAFGSWVILVLWGVADGFVRSMTESQARFDQGDLQLRAAGYAADPVPSHGLTAAQSDGLETLLAGFPAIDAAPRLAAFGLLRSAYGSDGVEIRGIDPEREREVTTLHTALIEGRFVQTSGEIALPVALAESLDIRLGERVVLVGQGTSGTESIALRTVGIFRVELGTLERVAVIPLEDARRLTGWAGTTAFALRLPAGASSARTIDDLESALSTARLEGVEVADYFALNPFARIMLQGTTFKMIPFVIMISLLAGFGVANTTFYSVLERTREFGVMAAVGMGRRLLAGVVLMEAIYVAAIGFIAGGGIGYGCLIYLSRVGLDFGEAMGEFGARLGIPTVMYASTSGWYWVAAFSVVVFTAVVAAWYPARRANRLEPVTAIREG